LSVFGFHVTGLAKADQVFAAVGFLAGGEEPEGADMVDRQALSQKPWAMGAKAPLLDNNAGSRLRPIGATVGNLAPFPVRSVGAGQEDGSVTPMAKARTKLIGLLRLSGLPCRAAEFLLAKEAAEQEALLPLGMIGA
jgi:hypothetical protein